MKNFFIVLFMKILNIGLKICGKNGGNFLGKIAYKWNPDIFRYFKVNSPVIAVTATNGKTMTNNAIGYVFKTANKKVISNIEGNNMETGILSTLLKNCSLTGKINADFLVFEVDEGYVPIVFKDFPLDTLVVLDFFRDQLDRNGEVETLILKINEFLKTFKGNLVLNNDDPNVSRLGKANPENFDNVYYFSVDKYDFATKEQKEAGEGKFCPFCQRTVCVYGHIRHTRAVPMVSNLKGKTFIQKHGGNNERVTGRPLIRKYFFQRADRHKGQSRIVLHKHLLFKLRT